MTILSRLDRVQQAFDPTVSKEPQLSQPDQIQILLDQYLSYEKLNSHLADLPRQFVQSKPRSWPVLAWAEISSDQIIEMSQSVFLNILIGCLETEAPIHGYAQTSWQYLAPLHPDMARYAGGYIDLSGHRVEPGLWEREERRHTPAMLMICRQLQGKQSVSGQHQARAYRPTSDPHWDLYRHGIHRIATEWGAVCLYLWLMTHTTGPLQTVFRELLQDEVNHLTKFWGFGAWAYPPEQRPSWLTILGSHLKWDRDRSGLFKTFHRMMTVLQWHCWSWQHRREFMVTCVLVLRRMWSWQSRLTPSQLQSLFGPCPIKS